jgi:hypothetical protein
LTLIGAETTDEKMLRVKKQSNLKLNPRLKILRFKTHPH